MGRECAVGERSVGVNDMAATWLMRTLTPSPLFLSLMSTFATLPFFLFTLPAGAVADMFDRRNCFVLWICGWRCSRHALRLWNRRAGHWRVNPFVAGREPCLRFQLRLLSCCDPGSVALEIFTRSVASPARRLPGVEGTALPIYPMQPASRKRGRMCE